MLAKAVSQTIVWLYINEKNTGANMGATVFILILSCKILNNNFFTHVTILCL